MDIMQRASGVSADWRRGAPMNAACSGHFFGHFPDRAIRLSFLVQAARRPRLLSLGRDGQVGQPAKRLGLPSRDRGE
jgi:hypothetical protein